MRLVAPSPAQRHAVRDSTGRLNIWEGSVRSGKTISSLVRWVDFVRNGPAGNLAMIGKTELTLRRNIIDPLVEMLGARRCQYHPGNHELILCGRRIYLIGANDERSITKIQGVTLAGAYGDELTTWPESFFTMLVSRLSEPRAAFFGTTNPDGPRHWLKIGWLDRATSIGLGVFHFTLDDNPGLDPAYVTALKREYVGLWYLRYILGRWVAAEGAVYPMLDPASHVVDELPEIRDWWVAVDYGTVNPFVALLIGEGADSRFYIAREWRWDSAAKRRQLTDADYSARLRRWLTDPDLGRKVDPRRIYVDPSAASFIGQLYDDRLSGVTAADNTVLDGIRSVSSLLAADRIRIHRSCSGLVDELVGYVWDPKATAAGEDAPLKTADHGPDALRYGIMGLRPVWRPWLAAA